MSKCHPNQKRARRRQQQEIKKLQNACRAEVNRREMSELKVDELERYTTELRHALREVGGNHNLVYPHSDKDGTLISYAKVNAEELVWTGRIHTKDELENLLVSQLAESLISRGMVRIEEAEYQEPEDRAHGLVAVTARIDVIPWYRLVRPKVVITTNYRYGALRPEDIPDIENFDWRKSDPNFDKTVAYDELRQEVQLAKSMKGATNNE